MTSGLYSILLVYVGDLIIIDSDSIVVSRIIHQLNSNFSTKDLSLLTYFCGIEVLPTLDSLLLSKCKYFLDLLAKQNMISSKPIPTPYLATGTPLSAQDGTPPVNATLFHQVLGGLQHLRMTRPDIDFAINKLSQFMHAPTTHWAAVKHLLCYLNNTRDLGINLLSSTPMSLHTGILM